VLTGARSSSGGAGGGSGPGFEARIVAWLASHLLARESLLATWQVSAAKIERVGSQTGFAVDDVGATTDRGGFVLVQAKRGLRLSHTSTSALADALDQVVRQFLEGIPDGTGSSRRVERGRDLLVICTDRAGSSRVKRDLAAVVARLATDPPENPIDKVARNSGEREALTVLRSHVDAAFKRQCDGAPANDHQVREIAKVLHIAELALNAGESDRNQAEAHLRGLLDDPDWVGGAWNDLSVSGQSLLEHQQWADRAALKHALASAGHPIGVDPLYRNDVARLRAVTAAALDTASEELVIAAPDARISVRREVAGVIGASDGNFALIGEAGSGKSVIAMGFASERRAAGEDVVFLQAESLAASLAQTTAELDLDHTIDGVLQGWGGGSVATLVVDGIDATRGSAAVDWLPKLARDLRNTRWRIVGTVRSFDLCHSSAWQQMFPGDPIDPTHAAPAFPSVRHLLVGDLSDMEMQQVTDQSAILATLIDKSEPRLHELLHNPFNLRLAAQLVGEDLEDVAAVRTRQDLLHLYWRRRVEDSMDHLARRRALHEICESMLARRRARITDPTTVVDSSILDAVSALLHDDVLREDVQSRRATTAPVIFGHPVLFDFAVAVMCFDDEDHLHLATRLDADPDLAITVRPSLDMHLADLWEDDASRARYWELVEKLSRPGTGHPIAAIAAACTALRERPTYAELARLEALAVQPANSAGPRMAVAYLAGALKADDVSIADRVAGAPALAELAATFAASAAGSADLGLADLARVLLLRLDRCFPLRPDSLCAMARASATADVMRTALAQPDDHKHEQLALRVGKALTRAAAVDPSAVSAVFDETISAATLAAWGGNVLAQQVNALADLASSDAELARRLALAPWTLAGVSDEATRSDTSQLIALTSNRQQELEMARYGTAQAFPAFLRASPEPAVRFFLEVVAIHGTPHDVPRADAAKPHVYWSENLQFAGGHESLNEMAHALVTYLQQQAASDDTQENAAAILDILRDEVSHDQVWRYLLDAGSVSPTGLGQILLPLLIGGELLGHSFTHTSAARLVAALSPLLGTEEHAALERAIHATKSPVNDDEEVNRTLVDALLGQLDPGHVQLAGSRTRLAELEQKGGAPAPPEQPPTINAWEGPMPVPDPSGDPNSPFRIALDQVRTGVTASNTGSTDDRAAARTRLQASVPALVSLLEGPDGPISQDDINAAVAWLLPAAEKLAAEEAVLPGTELGNIILGLFSSAS